MSPHPRKAERASGFDPGDRRGPEESGFAGDGLAGLTSFDATTRSNLRNGLKRGPETPSEGGNVGRAVQSVDRYGRLLATVRLPDGRDLGQVLVSTAAPLRMVPHSARLTVGNSEPPAVPRQSDRNSTQDQALVHKGCGRGRGLNPRLTRAPLTINSAAEQRQVPLSMERAPMLIDETYPVSEARAYLLAWLYDTFRSGPSTPASLGQHGVGAASRVPCHRGSRAGPRHGARAAPT